MKIIEQMAESRNGLLKALADSRANSLRHINDAETDSTARFERLRKEVEAEHKTFEDAIFECYGKPTEADAAEVTETEVMTTITT